MYKKLKLLLLTLISIMMLVGCQQTQTENKIETKTDMQSKDRINISYEKLSEKENSLLNVTGNNVVRYNIKNLPKDKKYKIELFYEEYKKGEKIREDSITGICNDDKSPKIESEFLTLNYQEDKIRFVFGENEGYASGVYEIKDKFEYSAQTYLCNDIDLELGKETYIYQASKGKIQGNQNYFDHIKLGEPIDKKSFDKIVKDSEGEVLVKLVYEEIK
ncbi:hypothetical protein QOZ84_06975 [Romboutsia sedimentorum]|uniref:Lipoprotein n=1 Tax=Romboutsia sedimentorum TaxID=1368474 RepID=A0ABT7EBH7_9FIRM|nr:hypothetical protein [Romboutsia sedimentorum]MDK2563286.1 hypothetical protein [Romboutsia sedimentorum]